VIDSTAGVASSGAIESIASPSPKSSGANAAIISG